MPRILSLVIFAGLGWAVAAQTSGQNFTTPQQSPPAPSVIAATVDGKPIAELAVYRAIGKRANQTKEARLEVLNYLIDTALVDKYLDQLKQTDKDIETDAREVDGQFQKVKQEIEANGKKMEEVYREYFLTEAELRTQIGATLRWEKFIKKYGSEKTLKDFFDANKAMFDGSSVHVRHILLTVPPGDAQAAAQAKNRIALLRKYVEDQVAKGLAEAGKLDNLQMQKLRMKLTEEAFAALAARESSCPTKSNGGDLGWFPRSGGGRVPDPFAEAAFGLQPWQMSDGVATEVGVHLILCLERREGVEPRYEDIREMVRDVYSDKMREAVVRQMRSKAKIVINPVPQ